MSATKTAIDHREYGFVMNSRYSSFSINGELPFTPLFIDPVLHIQRISNDYINAQNSGYSALRIYPGLTEDYRLVMIVCDVLAEDEAQEFNYRVYPNGFYLTPGSTPDPISFEEAQNLHAFYLSTVKVEGYDQPPIGSSNPFIRKSRTYYWENIREFVEENISGGTLNEPTTLGNHLIKLETGYIPEFLQESLLSRQPVSNPDYLRGFTVIFTLLNDQGSALIQADKLFDENAQDVYQRIYLEIANPCPPVCGLLN